MSTFCLCVVNIGLKTNKDRKLSFLRCPLLGRVLTVWSPGVVFSSRLPPSIHSFTPALFYGHSHLFLSPYRIPPSKLFLWILGSILGKSRDSANDVPRAVCSRCITLKVSLDFRQTDLEGQLVWGLDCPRVHNCVNEDLQTNSEPWQLGPCLMEHCSHRHRVAPGPLLAAQGITARLQQTEPHTAGPGTVRGTMVLGLACTTAIIDYQWPRGIHY